jgi:ATP sulfurylase
MSVVLPTMILNKQVQSIESASYWGLSQNHAQDLKNMVEKYYEPLKKFYDNNTIKNVLYEIQIKCEAIVLLSNQTPALTNIKVGDIETYSIFDKRMSTLLYEHYTLLVFSE